MGPKNEYNEYIQYINIKARFQRGYLILVVRDFFQTSRADLPKLGRSLFSALVHSLVK